MEQFQEITSLDGALYSKFEKDLSHLQTLIKSVSLLQTELSTKVDNLSVKQEQTSDIVNNIISGMSSNDKQASGTKRNESPELLQAFNSLKKDVDRKIDFNKEFKAEILENNIENDVRMDRLESLISGLSNDLQSLERQTNRMETTREGFNNLGKKLEDLMKNQEDHFSSIRKLNEQQTKDTTELEQLKYKVDHLDEMLREHNQRIEKVKQKCCEVCQLVATRVLPLERLKDGLSQNVSAIEVNNSKILVLENDVGNLKRFATEMMFSPIGFTAYLNEPVRLSASNTLLNGFTDVKVNVQNCFDPATGYFTAPFDGLYLASVTLCQMSTGYLEAFIFHGKHADQGDSWVAHVIGHREINGNSDTGVAVVSMKKQDTLCIKVTDLGLLNRPWLTECTSFSCFLIDRC